jgi:hypothetical protein
MVSALSLSVYLICGPFGWLTWYRVMSDHMIDIADLDFGLTTVVLSPLNVDCSRNSAEFTLTNLPR